MLTNVSGKTEPLFTRDGRPGTDSYGEPTDRLEWDTDRVPLRRARLERGPSIVRELEGMTLAEDEAVLIVLRRWEPNPASIRVETDRDVWTLTSTPIVRVSLASGTHSVAKLKRLKVTS
ncbi:head-to-tail stopper [Microbacterium phage UtzChips]|nr:head-to-tail stopper [Microbacterium phage UtzChips]